MIDTLACRQAVPDDVSAIEALAARSIRALHAGAYDDAVIREAIDHAYGMDWQLVRDGTYFVAMAAGTIVGAGGWSYRRTIAGAHGPDDPAAPRLSPTKDAARIRAFYVDPGYARRGIGALLLGASERGRSTPASRARNSPPLSRRCRSMQPTAMNPLVDMTYPYRAAGSLSSA
jgi:GNAT superfamily N-acetyltransferase